LILLAKKQRVLQVLLKASRYQENKHKKSISIR